MFWGKAREQYYECYQKECVRGPAARCSKGQFGGKESLLYFTCWQLCEEGGRHLFKQRVTAFLDRVGCGRMSKAETAQSSLTVIFKLAISGLTGIILVVLGTVNLQFWRALVHTSLQSILRIVAAHVLGTVCSTYC